VSDLEKTLRVSIDGMRQVCPLASHAFTDGPDPKPAGLPVPDLEPLHARSLSPQPWWARVLPLLAVRVARSRIEDKLGGEIDACVDAYDRQLGAWVKLEIERLVEHYELKAAPAREQVRRLAADGGPSSAAQDGQNVEELEADLRELRRTNHAVRDSDRVDQEQSVEKGCRMIDSSCK
jgi:hypothetical protein